MDRIRKRVQVAARSREGEVTHRSDFLVVRITQYCCFVSKFRGPNPWSQALVPEGPVERKPPARPQPLPPRRYFLMERGKNMCGLAACASYPIPLV